MDNESLLAMVNRFPGPTNHSITGEAENESVKTLVEEVLAGGKETIVGLVNLLAEPGKSTPEDAKARFLLHAAVVRVGDAGRDRQRKTLATTLAELLATERPREVLACLVRELQWIADAEHAPALGKLLADDSLREDAARALAHMGGDAAAAEFRAALTAAKGKSRLTMIQNLGILRDAKSVEPLLAAASDADVDIRVAAVWALANIGEPSAVDVALKASAAEGSERVRHTKSCLLLAERLAASGRKVEARQVYNHLRTTRGEASEAYVREAAERGLAQIE